MFSIGQLAKQTGVKVPTIRYYEGVGLLAAAGRSEGNQRRYGAGQLEQLRFIKHARELGFPLEAISSLINLQNHPDQSCSAAKELARTQLQAVQQKIKQLTALETELKRIYAGCGGDGRSRDCYVLASLADHGFCIMDH